MSSRIALSVAGFLKFLNLKVVYEGLGHRVPVLYVGAAVVEVFLCCDVETPPVFAYHVIGSELVVMPSRQMKCASVSLRASNSCRSLSSVQRFD